MFYETPAITTDVLTLQAAPATDGLETASLVSTVTMSISETATFTQSATATQTATNTQCLCAVEVAL